MTDQMHVTGGQHAPAHTDISRERMQEMTAEAYAWELVEALKAAVAGLSHWRLDAQALLRKIDAGEYPDHG